MPETSIRPALPAQELSGPLIEQHHEHLAAARILWLFTTSRRTRGGHVTLGTAARSSPLQRFLSSGNESVQTGHDYIVQIDEGRWRRALATQRAALVDHLLCRMVQREVANKRTGEITRSWGTVGPDIEEFSDVILRHGVWLPEQQVMANVMREQGNTLRLSLPDLQDEPADEPEAPPKSDTPKRARQPRRKTVAEPDGIVVSTQQIADGVTHFVGDDCDPPHAELAAEAEPPSTNGTASDYTPSWLEQTGVGSSEPERRRRGRPSRTASAAGST